MPVKRADNLGNITRRQGEIKRGEEEKKKRKQDSKCSKGGRFMHILYHFLQWRFRTNMQVCLFAAFFPSFFKIKVTSKQICVMIPPANAIFFY